MTEATVASNGQLVIPEPIREHLHLKDGDRLDFVIRADGDVILRPAAEDVRKLKGCLPRPPKPVSLEEMNRAIRKRARKSS